MESLRTLNAAKDRRKSKPSQPDPLEERVRKQLEELGTPKAYARQSAKHAGEVAKRLRAEGAIE